MTLFLRFTAGCTRVLLAFGAFGLVLMTLIVGWQVFGRYVLNQSPDWSEQAALVLMIWYVCFAAAAGVKQGFHIRVVALENIASRQVKHLMRRTNFLVVAVCGLIMFFWGGQLVSETWYHAVPTLPLTRGMVYLAVPVAGAVIFLFSLENLLLDLTNTDGDDVLPSENQSDPEPL